MARLRRIVILRHVVTVFQIKHVFSTLRLSKKNTFKSIHLEHYQFKFRETILNNWNYISSLVFQLGLAQLGFLVSFYSNLIDKFFI